MSSQLQQIEEQALRLSPQEREALADTLLQSVEQEPLSEVDETWIAEAERRLEDWRSGQTHDNFLLPMSLHELEQAVQTLPPQDFTQFAAWFDELRAELWDRQIERDAISGKLDHLAQEALAEFRQGKITRLP